MLTSACSKSPTGKHQLPWTEARRPAMDGEKAASPTWALPANSMSAPTAAPRPRILRGWY
jgi:hypothetical protein